MKASPAAAATAVTAVAALITAVVATAGLFFTGAQIEQAQQGQFTDRYTRAVAELGDTAPDVRLGGVYALVRLAHDSPSDAPTITYVLAAYVRDHVLDSRDPACVALEVKASPTAPLVLPNDVRAAVQALGAVNVIGESRPGPNLSNVCLPRTDILATATLSGANLSGADLAGARLDFAQLGSANLLGANLTDAHLGSADLTDANLAQATVSGATGANYDGTIGVPRAR